MKNTIFLLIDSLDYSKLGKGQFKDSSTPFIDSLLKKSYYSTSMYAQAPYTEAALMSTICGCDTLDNNGYLMRYKYCPQNVLEFFDKKKFDVYHQVIPHIYPTSMKKGINNLFLASGSSFKALWMYRLEYYAELHEQEQLDEVDYQNIAELLEDNLKQWIKFNNELLIKDKAVEVILANTEPFDYEKDTALLNEQYELFSLDSKAYIECLLKSRKQHILFSLNEVTNLNHKIKDKNRQGEIINEYQHIGEDIFKLQNRMNRKNNHISLSKLYSYSRINHFNLKQRNSCTQYLRNYIKIKRYSEAKEKICKEYDNKKDGMSMKSQLVHFLDWEKQRKNKEKPFFSYIHIDDIHAPSAIFSYDSIDEKLLREQFDRIENYLKKLPNYYRGNLIYDLSLLYVDGILEWFFNKLEKQGYLEDTNIIITADHGYSFYYHPLRESIVHSFYKENYSVPFIIYSKEVKAFKDEYFHLTKDIAATLVDLHNFTKPENFTGDSVFSSNKRTIIHQEYMGPGCPDMYRKPFWMCAFDGSFKVFLKVKLTEEFDNHELCAVFDLTHDSNELNNLINKIDYEKIRYLIDYLRERFNNIKNTYTERALK